MFPESPTLDTNACCNRFDAQFAAFRERFDSQKVNNRVVSTASDTTAAGFGSRIAKPLRGGGGGGDTTAGSVTNGTHAISPAVANLQAEKDSGNGKRTSWFFNQRSWTGNSPG